MFTIWFTGFSGSGKSTLSSLLCHEVRRRGLKAEWLDGDIIRSNFSQELTFSRKDRDINVKRIGFVSHLLNKNAVVAVVAAIAPFAEARSINRELIGDYVEVFCDASLEKVAERDVKGLYKRAFAGDIPEFTGVSSPYELPLDPDIHVRTDSETVEESFCTVIRYLEEKGAIPPGEMCVSNGYTEDQEIAWRKRLAALGFAKS